MHNVLIVDDEAPAREILKLKIDWESIDCHIIGMAKNGQEALDFYIEHKPDLVITDIQMPVMDGLELIKSINSWRVIFCLATSSLVVLAIKPIM